jgi:hypothetical protein
MTKRGKKLFVTVVVLAGGLLMLAWALWRRAGEAPVLGFLGDQQAVYHVEARGGRIDVYSWPADYESVATEAAKELLQVGFEGISGPANPNYRMYVRPGPHQIVVRVRRAKLEKATGISREYSNTPGWVVVDVEQIHYRPFEYLGRLWDHAWAPRPSFPPPQSATGQ